MKITVHWTHLSKDEIDHYKSSYIPYYIEAFSSPTQSALLNMKISHFLSFILISSIESKSNVTTIKKSKKTSYSFSSKKKSTSSSRNSSVHSGGARGPKTGAGTLAVRETARKLMGAFSGKVLKEHFYHGPDVSRAMVIGHAATLLEGD